MDLRLVCVGVIGISSGSEGGKHSIEGDRGTGGGDCKGFEGMSGDSVTVMEHSGTHSSSHSLEDSLMLNGGCCSSRLLESVVGSSGGWSLLYSSIRKQ